jgi:hypothetical protein
MTETLFIIEVRMLALNRTGEYVGDWTPVVSYSRFNDDMGRREAVRNAEAIEASEPPVKARIREVRKEHSYWDYWEQEKCRGRRDDMPVKPLPRRFVNPDPDK